jgi:hypothetical protein
MRTVFAAVTKRREEGILTRFTQDCDELGWQISSEGVTCGRTNKSKLECLAVEPTYLRVVVFNIVRDFFKSEFKLKQFKFLKISH